MIRIVTIVGARPQFIKAAAINRAIRLRFASQIDEIIVHTGQHYDTAMSKVFFEELSIPPENYNLNVGSDTHAVQTAAMMVGIEEILQKEKPDALVLYGDTNSTLAGAVAAAKMHLPIIHIEGGVRSYNKKFPEEVNRLVCDHLSTLIFVPTLSGMESLYKEGFRKDSTPPFTADNPKVYHCGDIMYDNSLHFAEIAFQKSTVLKELGLAKSRFGLVTMHRPSNVDDRDTLGRLFKTFSELARAHELLLVIPLHPRTVKAFGEVDKRIQEEVQQNELIKILPAISFLDITALESRAEIIFTDSGGVQKEAYYFKRPCVILLEETPWVELIESGSAMLTGSDPEKIKQATRSLLSRTGQLNYPGIFGDGQASYFIVEKIIENFAR